MTTKVGDFLTRENAREGMEFQHGEAPVPTMRWTVQKDTMMARCKEGPAGSFRISWGVPATILSIPRELPHQVPVVSAPAMGWVAAPPDPPVKTLSGRCDHGYIECTRCDYDRQYYAKATNETVKTEGDKRGAHVVVKGVHVVRVDSSKIVRFADFAENLLSTLRECKSCATVLIELSTGVGRKVLEGTDEEFERIMPYLAAKEGFWTFKEMKISKDSRTEVEYYQFWFRAANVGDVSRDLKEEIR